jgi:hypothetical protein
MRAQMGTGEKAGQTQSVDEIVNGIIAEMRQYIEGYHYPYDRWFVGVSEDPGLCLLGKHRMNPNIGPCIHIAAPTADAARAVGKHFIETMGSDGDVSGGGNDARFVYAYKKSMHTRP